VHRDLKPENILYRGRDPDSDIVIVDFGIAKHLESDQEVLHNLSGSFGYVAPEVLSNLGHGKPVDIWSTGIISYVLLCGYSPFRSEDPKLLIKETIRAQIEFHDQYWHNISSEAKDFIHSLLNVNPLRRLTSSEALSHPWLTTHLSADHDLVDGLRQNFNARAQWKRAIASARAVHRLGLGIRGNAHVGPIIDISDEEDTDVNSLEIGNAVPATLMKEPGDHHMASQQHSTTHSMEQTLHTLWDGGHQECEDEIVLLSSEEAHRKKTDTKMPGSLDI